MKSKFFLNLISSKGFTLVELLIVITILGILSMAVLIAVNPSAKINSAKVAVLKSDMSQLVNALQIYYMNAGAFYYPALGATATTGLGAIVPSELKSLPRQQTGASTCPASPNGLNAGLPAIAYCYVVNSANFVYAGTTYTVSQAVAIWGNSFPTGYWCWDSSNGAYKVSSTVPTAASPVCP